MAKRPGSGTGIGVNYRPPGYRAVARRVDVEALEAGAAKKQAANAPNKPAQPQPHPSGTAAGPPSPEAHKKPK